MRSDDEDFLAGRVPSPDDEPTAAELAHAKTFASLVESGRAPAAMSTDDRALLEVATMIRATAGGLELAAARKSSLVEAALRQAIGGVSPALPVAIAAPIVAIQSRRRWLPWSIAATTSAVAAAAIFALWIRAPHVQTTAVAAPASWMSRPSDGLIGPIAREHAGDASTRIDAIFADRLDGYRERTYARGGRR